MTKGKIVQGIRVLLEGSLQKYTDQIRQHFNKATAHLSLLSALSGSELCDVCLCALVVLLEIIFAGQIVGLVHDQFDYITSLNFLKY